MRGFMHVVSVNIGMLACRPCGRGDQVQTARRFKEPVDGPLGAARSQPGRRFPGGPDGSRRPR